MTCQGLTPSSRTFAIRNHLPWLNSLRLLIYLQHVIISPDILSSWFVSWMSRQLEGDNNLRQFGGDNNVNAVWRKQQCYGSLEETTMLRQFGGNNNVTAVWRRQQCHQLYRLPVTIHMTIFPSPQTINPYFWNSVFPLACNGRKKAAIWTVAR